MSATYTLAQPATRTEDIRKSRFLAQALPLRDAGEALELVRGNSDPTATHNCWAYRFGQAYRFNDDGEPGGTAGRPILQAIENQDCDRVLVVVTRWYGGIKLGAGGLARAYGGTAAECLRRADRVPLVAMARLAMHCPFADLALFKARLREMDTAIDSEDFDTDGAVLIVSLPVDRVDEVAARLADLGRGRVVPRRLDEAY
jgi:uncharacterized YigZ family protein